LYIDNSINENGISNDKTFLTASNEMGGSAITIPLLIINLLLLSLFQTLMRSDFEMIG
jgi:hypothetical protein